MSNLTNKDIKNKKRPMERLNYTVNSSSCEIDPKEHEISLNYIKRDNLHFNFTEIDGYNKLFNVIICEREAGKTSALEYSKFYKGFIYHKFQTVFLVRQINKMNREFVEALEKRINLYLKTPIQLGFKSIEINGGAANISIYLDDTWQICGKLVALNSKEQVLKNIFLENPKYVIFDEYLVNIRDGEKYLNNEFHKIKVLLGTLLRYAKTNMKCYFAGNPYTKYTPIFLDYKIDTNKLKSGKIVTKKDLVIQCYKLKPELKAKLLKENPLYQFDDSYKRFAFDAEFYQDENINIIKKTPQNYKLKDVIYNQNTYVGIFANFSKLENTYFCAVLSEKYLKNYKKKIFCFQTYDLNKRRIMQSKQFLKDHFANFSYHFANGNVGFYKPDAYGIVLELLLFLSPTLAYID